MSDLVELYDAEPDAMQLAFGLAEQEWIPAEDMHALMNSADTSDEGRVELEMCRRLAWHRWGYSKFRAVICPGCEESGLARWRFLGRLRHPSCGAPWTTRPLAWIGMQGRGWFSQAGDGGSDGCLDAIKKFIGNLAIALVL